MTYQRNQRVTLTEDGATGVVLGPYDGMPGVDSYVVRLDGSDRTLAVMAHHLTPDLGDLEPDARHSAKVHARRSWAIATIGATRTDPFDALPVHGPEKPPIIAERLPCPTCDAPAGTPCYGDGANHARRHRAARGMLDGMTARRRFAADRAYHALVCSGVRAEWRREYDTGTVHGPETDPVAHDLDVLGDLLRPDCGCGWGKLCDGPRHAGRCVCRWQQVARDDMSFGPGDLRYDGYPDPDGNQTFDTGRMHGPDDLLRPDPGAAIADAMRLAATDPNAARARMRDLRAAMGDDAFEAAKASAIAHLQTR
jgi:hypothetical protein